MKQLVFLGRILFAIPIAVIGLTHFFFTPEFLLKLEHSLIPGSIYTVVLSGVMLIVVSILIVLNKYVRVACYWLSGMLVIVIATIHVPNLFYPELYKSALMEILQDTAILGAALMIPGYLSCQNKVEKE
jgi:uncharacterized membrane protein YphA (DoxX/SURF4 family)